jgi:hypothetical protein
MALTIFIPAKLVLKVNGWPVTQALIMAFTSNALGKLFVSVMHLPQAISYSLPTLAFFALSIVSFARNSGGLSSTGSSGLRHILRCISSFRWRLAGTSCFLIGTSGGNGRLDFR